MIVRGGVLGRVGLVVVVVGVVLGCLGGVAVAGPVWSVGSLADTTVAPGGSLDYLVEARNVGDVATDGSQISVTARLPVGMSVVSASLLDVKSGSTFRCFDGRDGVSPVAGASSVVCEDSAVVDPRQGSSPMQKLSLRVSVSASSGVLTTVFGVSGGGAAPASTVDPTRVSPVPPGFGLDAFDGFYGDASGNPLEQAGGHPEEASVSLDFNTLTNEALPLFGSLWPVEPVKDVVTDLPAGMVGNPNAVDQCTLTELAHNNGTFDPEPECPATSQVGTTVVRIKGGGGGLGGPDEIGPLPVFSLVPPPGVPAAFGFNVLGNILVLDARVRTGGDYGVSVDARNLPEALAIIGTTVTFWGVPADPSHTFDRACPGNEPPINGGPSCATGTPLRAFLRLPTSCSASGLVTSASVDSWTHPGIFPPASSWTTHEPPGYPAPLEDQGPAVGLGGCENVPFTPAFSMEPSPPAAGGPVGFGFDLSLPQSDDPAVTGEADLKSATVTLPPGVRVNPSSADGLQGCSPDQIALHAASAPGCPDASKVGTVTINTPLLRDPVTGGVYLASPFDNPFGSLIAVYLTASADGVIIKLAGQGTLDPATGQLTTRFDNNPQTPFTHLHLELFGGPRAPLSLPEQCGTYTGGQATLTGWNGATVTKDLSFTVSQDANGQPCPATFAPGFSAGTVSNRAGSSSAFDLRLTRSDADQEIGRLNVLMPSGLTGRIASVALCPAAQASAGTCPEASRIGDVSTGAGAGSNPFFITAGRAYLTGPYKGAPFGVSIVVPAIAGPFNLGDVVVQSALFVDKKTADVSIVSDPLPTILQGIPLNVRDIRVDVNRPGFFLNPTSCARKTIYATVQSTLGALAHVSDRFQAAECASLAFKPRMVLTVGGAGHTQAGRTTPLSTTLTMPSKGQANIRYVRVTLPTTINARLTVINDACTRAQFETNITTCAHAKAGTATATTPLLAHPLRGNVYFVRNGHGIPDLFVALRGQVAFDLIGRITIVNNRLLRTTFPTAPDVPIRTFTLHLLGDPTHGSIGALTNLCTTHARTAKANVDYIAQNGKTLQTAQALHVNGCPRPKHKGRH